MNWRLVAGLTFALTMSMALNWHLLQRPAAAASTARTMVGPPAPPPEVRTVTQLKCPDGTVLTQTDDATAPAPAPAPPPRRDPYSLGAAVDPRDPKQNFELRAGARLGDLPARAVVGAGMREGKPAFTLGVDVDVGGK